MSVRIFRKPLMILSLGLMVMTGIWRLVSSGGFSHSSMYALQKVHTQQKNLVHILVIGSGCAGYPAALYGARRGFLTVQLLGDAAQEGGQLNRTTRVDNWPALVEAQGPDIMDQLKAQAQKAGVVMLNQKAIKINTHVWPYQVETDTGLLLNCLTIIYAAGSSPTLLHIPGEQEYWGKGVTTCAICDAPFYKDKDVIVVGGGDSAAEEAIQLAPYARSITVMVRKDKMRANPGMQARLSKIPSIKIAYNTELQEIMGDGKQVNAVRILDNKTGQEKIQPIDGVFLAIGHKPNTALVKGHVELDAHGYIVYPDGTQQSSRQYIFAAGDVGDPVYKQAIIAAGDGAKASIEAAQALEHMGLDAATAQKLGQCNFSLRTNPDPATLKPLTKISSFTEFDALAQQDKVVVVDCYTAICPSCTALMPALQAAAHHFASQVVFVKADMGEFTQFVEKYHVIQAPTLLVFKQGTLIGRHHSSVLSKEQLYEFVQQFIKI